MLGYDRDIIAEATYIVETKATIRETAEFFCVGKTALHKDVTKKLMKVDAELAKQVQDVLNENKAERHIRGGEATKQKYATKKDHI
jgi:putative DeoR family transcriptional regulator (stage III sporulation protein D)